MKRLTFTFAGIALLCAIAFGLSSCVGGGADVGVYYGSHDHPWFNEGPWMYGHDWYHHGNDHHGWAHVDPWRR